MVFSFAERANASHHQRKKLPANRGQSVTVAALPARSFFIRRNYRKRIDL